MINILLLIKQGSLLEAMVVSRDAFNFCLGLHIQTKSAICLFFLNIFIGV